ncbi:MAG: hypothetical protein ACKVON_17760 [Beijerinckiaceae bacterium]
MQHANRRFLAATLLVCSGLSACDHKLDRRDQVTFGVGDSIAANKATHIIDPWPASARNVEQGISGEQAETALARMRRNANSRDGEQKSPTLTTSSAPVTLSK